MTELEKATAYYPTLNHALSLMTEPGTVLEFGVQGGGSMNLIRDKAKSGSQLFGFDTFTGLPEDWLCLGRMVIPKGTFDNGGNVPVMDGVTFYKGLFTETIPEYLKEHSTPISLIHMDCDLYSSCCDVLNGVGHLIIKGTIISFDEWTIWQSDDNNDGEQKAFREWCDLHSRTWEDVPFTDPVSPDRHIVIVTN